MLAPLVALLPVQPAAARPAYAWLIPARAWPPQVAMVGFAVQALVSRTTPLEGLAAHLSNPGKNITYYLTHLPETLAQ